MVSFVGLVASEGFVVNLSQSCLITVTKEERKNSHTSHTSLQRNPVADPGEGPREPASPPPLIFRPKRGPKGQKKFFWRLGRLFSKGLDDPPPPPPPPYQGLDSALFSFMCEDCDFASSICLYLLLCVLCVWLVFGGYCVSPACALF